MYAEQREFKRYIPVLVKFSTSVWSRSQMKTMSNYVERDLTVKI